MTGLKTLRQSTSDREALAWRIVTIQRTVARGCQDPRDLESALAHGYVTKPVDEFRRMHIDAAREIDRTYKPRKPR